MTQRDGLVVVTTHRGGSLCTTDITYTLAPQGTMDVDATFTPHTDNLRRAGLVCYVDSTLKNVDYYALGPWENYVDRKDGCLVGRYLDVVDLFLAGGEGIVSRDSGRHIAGVAHLRLGARIQ